MSLRLNLETILCIDLCMKDYVHAGGISSFLGAMLAFRITIRLLFFLGMKVRHLAVHVPTNSLTVIAIQL